MGLQTPSARGRKDRSGDDNDVGRARRAHRGQARGNTRQSFRDAADRDRSVRKRQCNSEPPRTTLPKLASRMIPSGESA
jgi:hypothetical protein